MNIFILLSAVSLSLAGAAGAIKQMHMMQQNSYYLSRYFKWLSSQSDFGFYVRTALGVIIAVEIGAGGTLRGRGDLLDRQVDAVGLVNADDLDLDLLSLLQMLRDLIDIGISDLRDVHQTGATLRQRHERAKLGNTRNFSVQDRSNTKLHTDL